MTPNYGYITTTTQGYEPLTKILIDHLTTYSKYHITLITINYTTTLKHPKLTTKRIDIQPYNHHTINTIKYQATINTPYTHTLTLHADTIPLPNIDNLLETHAQNPNTQNNTQPTCCPQPHPTHTHWYHTTFITTPQTTPQLQKLLQTLTKNHTTNDQTTLNNHLNNNPPQQHTPHNYITNWTNYTNWTTNPNTHLIHGCKNPKEAKKISNKIKTNQH